MTDEVTKIRNKIKSEAERMRAEREMRQRRHEILLVAAQIAAGAAASGQYMSSPDLILNSAELLIDELDKRMARRD